MIARRFTFCRVWCSPKQTRLLKNKDRPHDRPKKAGDSPHCRYKLVAYYISGSAKLTAAPARLGDCALIDLYGKRPIADCDRPHSFWGCLWNRDRSGISGLLAHKNNNDPRIRDVHLLMHREWDFCCSKRCDNPIELWRDMLPVTDYNENSGKVC